MCFHWQDWLVYLKLQQLMMVRRYLESPVGCFCFAQYDVAWLLVIVSDRSKVDIHKLRIQNCFSENIMDNCIFPLGFGEDIKKWNSVGL